MKSLFWPALAVVVMLLAAPHAWAVTTTSTGGITTGTGETALAVSTYMYCGAKSLISGYIGLLLGLALAALGLWALIQGKGLVSGMTLIVAGSLVTALPGLIEGGLTGFSGLMTTAGITTAAFSTPICGNSVPVPPEASNPDLQDPAKLSVNMMNGQQLDKETPYSPTLPYMY